MFNLLRKTFSNLTNIIKAPAKQIEVQETIPEVIIPITPRTKTRKSKNEIDNLFFQLSKEMDIPFVKGPFVIKEKEAKAPKAEKAPRELKPIATDTTGLLGKYLKKDITVSTLWNAINNEYFDNEAAIIALSQAYPEQFSKVGKDSYRLSAKKMEFINKLIVNA